MAKLKSSKYIFVVGGVMSSVGKGITCSAIARILQSKGYRVATIKCDMYVNIDAGTIRPTEHGEVFVGEDGIEADQDLGNYERFTDNNCTAENYITTGQVYQEVIRKERNLEYGGEDVEVVPDIPNEIIRRIKLAVRKNKADITVIEIGGTVGEYQSLLFLEAGRMMKLKYPDDVAFVLVSYLPIPKKIGEMKTKPTQYAARTLNSAGIQTDFIICRAERPLDEPRRDRLAVFCSIEKGNAISAPDLDSIYELPVVFEKEHLGDKILDKLNLKAKQNDLKEWKKLVKNIKNSKKEIKIGIVGKYFGTGNFTLADSYISVIEAIKHACWHHKRKPQLTWIDSEEYEKNPSKIKELSQYNGIIVPGGFGSRGIEGIIKAIRYVREHKIPYLGLCYGMQLATIEIARNVVGLKKANSLEIDPKTPHPVIHLNPYQKKNIQNKSYGATMRLGAYPCVLKPESLSYQAYETRKIQERHRHRYEFNDLYKDKLEKAGVRFAGICPSNNLVEIIELTNHPWFVGVQFHPEFKSRPLRPHPLFRDFIAACIKAK
ncbi:MAG: CTP synthase [Candidatus Kerfeldbacteria bacterium CG_4_10_14_0_8_um_filter_42_10]|uniref:CTP synthase n=1 Tax=Candidatus Kerfeldbacteria bacterium CG_4_10_14_0_8_um_filter_42_10 TaxID=2014248 RepID=A0A2M7RL93_9BACT|nr:MAG: CTP synthase [Candidatus Kerfeldbacteria bacterium CG_4_10_14_0_8_um_filter_42_10]